MLGCPTGRTVGNQQHSENSGTEDADRETPLRPDGPPAVKTQLLAARGGDARARCLRPLGWPPQSRRLGTRRLAPPALYAARLLRCVSLRSHTPVAAAARRTARRQDAAACRSWRRRSRALLAPARLATAVAAARHSAACASCAVNATRPRPRRLDGPPAVKTQLLAARGGDARARCLRPLGWPPQSRRLGTRRLAPPALHAARLLRCVSLRSHTPVAAAARRTARRQDAAACRSWRRRSRALLAPARLATAVAAARHSAACAACAARGAAPALCFSTEAVSDITTAEGSQRDGRRRNRALQGGEPGGPASVVGMYAPGDTGNPLRDGGTFVLGCPTGGTVGNQKQSENSGTEDADRETPLRPDGPPAVKTQLLAARGGDARARCLRPLGWPPQSRRLGTRRLAPPALYAARLLRCVSLRSHTPVAAAARRTARRQDAAACRSWRRRSRALLAPARLATAVAAARHSAACASCAVNATRPRPRRLDGPPAVKTQLLAARGGDARAHCLRPLGWPPQSRRLGTRRLAPPALHAARLLRCVSLRSHTPVAAAARRTARRQDAAACRSWRRRSRALLAPARLATAVAAARHSAACASCAVRGASLALCFSTQPHARGRCGSTDRPPSRRSCLPLVAATLARAACARSVGHRSRGGSTLGGLRRLRCTVARLLRCVSLRRRSLTSQQQKVANETVVGAIGPSKEVSQAARRRSSVCMPRATRETPFGTVVPSCWGARPGGLSATRSKVKTPARRIQIARRRCGPTDRPPSRRSCLPLAAATLARAACARSVGHRSRGGSALGGLRLLRCTRRVSCAVFLYAATRPWPLRLDGPPAVKTQLLAARGGDARARCLRPLGRPPQSRRLDTRRLAPPALPVARLLRCVSLRRRTLTSQQQKVANETVVGAIGPSKEVSQAVQRRSSVGMPQATRETPLRDGGTFVLGCPTGETAGNQKQSENSGTEDADRETPLRPDGPPAVKTQLLAARGGDARARCLRPLGWPPQSRRLGTRRLAPPALYAARLLRCVSLRSHTPVAAAARRTARRQDAAACRSWRRRSRALLAPARLATAVAAARHSAACAACAARGAAPALCFSTEAVSDITTAEGSQRDGRRRNRALQGGEPGGPASVVGMYAPGDTGNPPSGRWYLRAGVPDRGDCRQPEAK